MRNILGMTECGGIIAIEPCAMPRTPGSVGLPIPFVTVRAVDSAGEPVPAGDDGELQIRGPYVSPGYTDAAKNELVVVDLEEKKVTKRHVLKVAPVEMSVVTGLGEHAGHDH